MWEAVLAYIISTGLVVTFTARGLILGGHGSKSWVAVVGLVGSTGVFFLRQYIEGESFRGAFWGAALVNVAMLGASRGRPHLLMSQLLTEPPRSGERGKEESDQTSTAVHPTQVRLLWVIVIGVVLIEIFDPDFLR